MVDCATDNTTRTVANVRVIFSRGGGNLGTIGSAAYLFDRKGFFKVEASKINLEEMELDLIDAGAEDIYEEEGILYIETTFNDFGTMQKKLDDSGIEIQGAELLRLPHNRIKVSADTEVLVNNLIEKMMEDDDVVNIFHNMEES